MGTSCALLGAFHRHAIALSMIWGGGDDHVGDGGSVDNVSIDADDNDHDGGYSYSLCAPFLYTSYYLSLLFPPYPFTPKLF